MPSGAAEPKEEEPPPLLLLLQQRLHGLHLRREELREEEEEDEEEEDEEEEEEEEAALGFRGAEGARGGRAMMAEAALVEPRGRRSVNSTESVAVPSSEHVAEIVGRQGCKIKALRAKTNTYIKTPVRGEEPVFVVTGRKEDVAAAKREILAAAEHFSLIRASRGRAGTAGGPGCAAPLPGQTTVQVRVPYRVVGLVVGPRGATIKRIQQQTHTYIVTPSRDKEPVFEVTGMPENVDRAREEIETHIALRTGAFLSLGRGGDFRDNGTDVGLEGGPAWPGARPALPARGRTGSSYRHDSCSSLGSGSTDSYLGGGRLADFSPSSPFGAGAFWFGEAPPAEEPPPDSPLFEPLPAPSPTIWAPLEPLGPLPGPGGDALGAAGPPAPGPSPPFPEERRRGCRSDPPSRGPPPGPPRAGPPAFSTGTGSYSSSAGGSASSSPPESRRRPECVLCLESRAGAAPEPCGHGLFCPRCAARLCRSAAPACPVCHSAATQGLQIRS